MTKLSDAMTYTNYHTSTIDAGFTIVELLVVIVVIGILAAISVVAYTGISQKAIASSLQSDLSGSASKLKMYQIDHGSYPTSLDGNYCPLGSAPSPDTRHCLKASPGTTLSYTAVGSGFTLDATHTASGVTYRVTEISSPTLVASLTCPSGFIIVPGSATYGTSDFCVMKYEAKQVGATNVPESVAAGEPWWGTVNRTTAAAYSANVVGCTGCHLITEAEWLTIAQNVLGVDSNWDDGAGNHAVGTGYIYGGNCDGNVDDGPFFLAASSNDADGYYGTYFTAPARTRRTLTLSNGNVIWDLSGNINEWTSGTTSGGHQPGAVSDASYKNRAWGGITKHGEISPDPFPATTGITGAGSWGPSNGIGRLISSNANDATLAYIFRGGDFTNNCYNGAGVLAMAFTTNAGNNSFGFRVTR